MPRVTSRDNPRLVELARLLVSSRDRRKRERAVLEGEHTIAVHAQRVRAAEFMVVREDRLRLPGVAHLVDGMPPADVLVVPAPLFASLAPTSGDVNVLAVVPVPAADPAPAASTQVLLDGLQDPGNVGTILRTAAAAGVAQVLLSPQCASAWSPKVLRAAQGAHFLTHVVEDVDLPSWGSAFGARGGQVIATVAHGGDDLYASSTPLRTPWALAIGNEGTGLSAPLAAVAETRVTIPMPGGMESLNAAAAAAVVLFELVRRARDAQGVMKSSEK